MFLAPNGHLCYITAKVERSCSCKHLPKNRFKVSGIEGRRKRQVQFALIIKMSLVDETDAGTKYGILLININTLFGSVLVCDNCALRIRSVSMTEKMIGKMIGCNLDFVETAKARDSRSDVSLCSATQFIKLESGMSACCCGPSGTTLMFCASVYTVGANAGESGGLNN